MKYKLRRWISAILMTKRGIYFVLYIPLKWMDQWTEIWLLVLLILRGRIFHYFFATQNVLVDLENPKEGHLMEYWFLAGFRFCSPLGTSVIKKLTSASLRRTFISRANNLAWRTDRDLALGDVTVFFSVLSKTYPASWTALSHVLMDTPLGTFQSDFARWSNTLPLWVTILLRINL